jgi:hypothetical protein
MIVLLVNVIVLILSLGAFGYGTYRWIRVVEKGSTGPAGDDTATAEALICRSCVY